jgi:hypothetical protein
MLQLKLIDKMAPQPYIISEYFKKKNVTASIDFDDDESNDIFIEDLLALASTDFIYHEAKRDLLPSIKEDGLLTSNEPLISTASEYKVPRTYILEKEPNNYSEVLLRFSKDMAGAINKDDSYILRGIPPEAIEVKINGSWYPLIS